MIDMHCHILPGVDDGAKDEETSLNMLKIAQEENIKKIIATPHYYKGYYENKWEDTIKNVKILNNLAKSSNINIELLPGVEVLADQHTVDLYNEGIIRGLNDTKYLLIEFPLMKMPKDALDIVYEIKLLGVMPVVAHPERYISFINDPTMINDFIDEGCLFQTNTSSITGLFGKHVKKLAERFIESGIPSFIATDAHTTGGRSPRFSEAFGILNKKNKNIVENFKSNVIKLLNNDDIQFAGEKLRNKKKMFAFLR